MGIVDKVKGLFKDNDGSIFDVLLGNKSDELYIKALAIAHAIDLIAKMVANTKINVYGYDINNKSIKEKTDNIYYRLNIKVNDNELGTMFKYKLVCKLLANKKALILEQKRYNDIVPYLYIADEWIENNKILYPKTFSNIIISDAEGNSLMLDKEYRKEEVIYLTLGNSQINNVIDDFYKEYSSLIKVASKSYKRANISKFRLKVPGGLPLQDPYTKKPMEYDEYRKKITNGLFDDEESILMLADQFELMQLNKETSKTSEDYRNLEKNVCDKIAMAFNIPLDVFYGTKTEKSNGTNDFITQAVEPIFNNIEDGFAEALIGETNYIKGERLLFNRINMKHVDITDVAGNLDKLTSIGFSHNDIRKMIQLPAIDEDWANVHYFTKNYAAVKGGER